MTTDRHYRVGDPLLAALSGLAVSAPAGVVKQVFAHWSRVEGPIGGLFVASTSAGVCFVRTDESVAGDPDVFRTMFRARFHRPLLPASRPPGGLLPALRAGRPAGVRLDLRSCTAFDRAVLAATTRIPPGQTRPYGWVAREAGRPDAVRAVGAALARNPVPVLVPCHRVTRADGTPGGYLFGPEVKERLLHAERVDLARSRELARAGVFFLGSDTTGVVCFPTCHHARRITPAHQAGFRRYRDAVSAGYRPCRHCRPGAVVDVGR